MKKLSKGIPSGLVLLLILQCPFFMEHCVAQLSVSTLVNNVHCYGQNNGTVMANPSGGVPPYTYQWSPGSQTNQVANALTAGTYTIHLLDNLGHTASASATVTQPAQLQLLASAQNSAVCAGSSDSIFAYESGGTPPYAFSWTGPLDDIINPSAQRTVCYPASIAYLLTAVSDDNGCSATTSLNITVHTPPLATISGPLSPVLASHNDTLIALAAGATGYLWSNGNTNSSIIVSPAVSTTYSVKVTNVYSCYDTNHYTVSPNSSGNGNTSGSAIVVSPNTNVTTTSYSTKDSVVWFSFVAANSNTQIIAYSAYLGLPFPHVHRLSLFDSSLHTLVDEPMPDIIGANQIRIDASNLTVGNTYYVRASRCPAHANMAGCNPSSSGECNASQRWDFQMCFRTVPVFVPDDSGSEPFSPQQLYFENRGQIADMNNIPRFDLKAYTNYAYPALYVSDSTVSFLYSKLDTAKSTRDTIQRVDMVLTGPSVEPSEPLFKMEEDSGAGYLNYFKEYAPNGVPKIEGYSRLVYKNEYPDIDMQVYSNSMGTKLYFICNPGGTSGGGNPANIELQFKGASSVSVNGSGGLDVVTELGTLSFAPGYAYEDSASIIKPQSWQPYFIAVNSNTVRFNTGSYNTNEPLIIRVDRGHSVSYNPGGIGNIYWSTYTGSGNANQGNNDYFQDVRTNNSATFAAGFCEAPCFPVTPGVVDSVYNPGHGGMDCIIAEFNKQGGGELNWATYYGGSYDDMANSITTDDNNSTIYVTGYTRSSDFPIKQPAGSYQQSYLNGLATQPDTNRIDADAFILVLNEYGTGTYWSTWFGGDNGGTAAGEVGYHVALKYNNGSPFPTDLYVVGGQLTYMNSSEVPLMHENLAYNSNVGTGWIARFEVAPLYGLSSPNAFGAQIWTTDIGGSETSPNPPSADALFGCCVDNANNLFVCGKSSESGYPTTAGTVQPSFNGLGAGDWNGVVTQFNSDDQLAWSTYFGGDASDYCEAIATDGYNIYITGYATSPASVKTIPLKRANAFAYYDSTNRAGSGGYGLVSFVAEITNSGSLVWSTYFGDANKFEGKGIAYDWYYHDIYVTGIAPSGSLPLPSPNAAGAFVQNSYGGGTSDAFVAAFNPACEYAWGTYFGGNGDDVANAAATDRTGIFHALAIAGSSSSTKTFPIFDAFQDTNYGGTDAFISYFNTAPVPITGIDVVTKDNNGITVYPNPSTNNIMLEMQLTEAGNVTFTLYNLVGEIVYEENEAEPAGMLNREINLSGLAAGTYILEVKRENDVERQKIVKL